MNERPIEELIGWVERPWTDCGCDLPRDTSPWFENCTQSRTCFAKAHKLGCPLRPLSGSSGKVAEGTGEAPADSLSAAPDLLGARPGPSARWIPGVVLDPFAGTGTTLAVAEYHGRDAIGIDLNPANALLVDARREEVRRALNPTHSRQTDGQLSLLEATP